MKKTAVALIAIVALIVGFAVAKLTHQHGHKESPSLTDTKLHNEQMHKCMQIALEKHPGAIIQVSLEKEDGKQIFDIDIQGDDGKKWEIECDVTTAEVVEDSIDRD